MLFNVSSMKSSSFHAGITTVTDKSERRDENLLDPSQNLVVKSGLIKLIILHSLEHNLNALTNRNNIILRVFYTVKNFFKFLHGNRIRLTKF